MRTQKNWISYFVIFAFLMLESVPVAELRSQEQQQRQQTPEEKARAIQRMVQQLQNAERAKTEAAQASPLIGQAPAPAAPAAPTLVQRPALAGDKVQLAYSNTELYDFIVQIAAALAISPIVIDPDVRGSVTIESSAPMLKDDVFPLFNMILKNNNAALIKQGDIYQIIPVSSALKRGLEIIDHLPPPPEKPASDKGAVIPSEPTIPISSQSNQPQPIQPAKAGKQPAEMPGAAQSARPAQSDDSKAPRLATHVIRVEFVPVRELLEPLKVFMTDGGVIMPYERLNMMIVTDYSDSVNKILEIVHVLDSSYLDPDLIELVRMQTNDAKFVVEDLRKIFGSPGKDASASSGGIYFTALDNLNAILVMANSKRALAEVKRWIKELDASTARSIQTYIYSVQNSTASNIALILSALFGGGEGSQTAGNVGGAGGGGASGARSSLSGGAYGSGSRSASGGGGTSTSSASSGLFGSGAGGTSTLGGTQGSTTGGGAFGSGQQLGPRLNQNPGISSGILKGGEFSGLQGDVRLVVDDINNALIIQASSADYAYISETIKKMDVLPRQVIIDARIFEVDLTQGLSFGVAASLAPTSAESGAHITGAAIASATGALTANTFAFIGNSRDILMNLNALQSKTKVRVLEAPSVLALDGTSAHIVVGSEVPYPGTSYVAPAGGATTSVQYRDTGVSLIVLPRISGSGTVTLTIAQEVSSAGSAGTLGPTFNKTSVDTTLAVQDGQTVAIAGLIRDSGSVNRNGVPFLSSIPLIGSLFGTSVRDAKRTELIILITPHVIKTSDRFDELTQELQDSLRNVRKLVDSKDKERLQDMEDARQDRYKEEEKKQKKIVLPDADKK